MSTSGSKFSTILIPGNSGASPKRSAAPETKLPGHGEPTSSSCITIPDHATSCALPEDRHREDPVVGVQRPPPRIVGEEHVALADLVRRPVGEDQAHELVDRRPVLEDVDAAVEAAAVGGHQRGVEVVALEDDERARQAGAHPRLVVVDRPQAVADHLEGDRIEAHASDTSSRSGSSTWATSAANVVAHPGQ